LITEPRVEVFTDIGIDPRRFFGAKFGAIATRAAPSNLAAILVVAAHAPQPGRGEIALALPILQICETSEFDCVLDIVAFDIEADGRRQLSKRAFGIGDEVLVAKDDDARDCSEQVEVSNDRGKAAFPTDERLQRLFAES